MSNLPSAPFQFRDQWYSLAPPWLRTGNGERYMYVLEQARDLLVEKMNQAVRIRLPGLGDPSQLPYLANDRGLVQGPGESNASFIARLRTSNTAWALAGSGVAVLQQLQAYMQNLQPGVPATNPLAILAGGPYSTISKWQWMFQGDAIGVQPTEFYARPGNFNWDGSTSKWWRTWLVLPMSLVATTLTGAAAATSTASGGSFTSPGQNVNGVWVATTSGTPVNAPFITVTGLAGMSSANVGMWITFSGSTHPTNNGTFQIVQYISPSSVVVANPAGVAADAGPLAWTVYDYPWIGPGLALGTPGLVWGQGEQNIPTKDTGTIIGGVWQPSVQGIPSGLGPVNGWGLDVSPNVIGSIRALVKTWKSASTYYPNIIVAFDCGNLTAGNAFSPYSSPGSGNPDGSFGSVGKNVGGVWVPSRKVSSNFDAYCQGTGLHQQCSEENIT